MALLDDILGGLQTVIGGATEIAAPGNPAGLTMMGSGLGQVSGGGGMPNFLNWLGLGSATPSVAQMSDTFLPGVDTGTVAGYSPTSGTHNFLSALGSSLPQILGMMGQGMAAVQPGTPQTLSPPGEAPFARMGAVAKLSNMLSGPLPQIQAPTPPPLANTIPVPQQVQPMAPSPMAVRPAPMPTPPAPFYGGPPMMNTPQLPRLQYLSALGLR